MNKPRMLDALAASLDEEPPADLLILVIGGNDFNRECDAGCTVTLPEAQLSTDSRP